MYFNRMHEMSLLTSILSIVRDELHSHKLTRLISVKICYGELAQVVPDSLYFAFEALTVGTDLDGAILELECIPLKLACGACKEAFSHENASKKQEGMSAKIATLTMSCPFCGAAGGHTVLAGKELYVAQMEAE